MSRYLDRKNRQCHGTVSEKRTMKKLGARLTPGSGSMDTAKSDDYDGDFQYENKATIHKSFSVKLAILKKVKKEARDVGRVPILCVCFVNGSGISVDDGDYVVMARDTFEDMKTVCAGKIL